MSFTLPPLPYEKNALEPHISAETVEFHYEKHHRGYVTKLNQLTQGSEVNNLPLEKVILTQKGKIFNMAAQVCVIVKISVFTSKGLEPYILLELNEA